MVRLISEKMEAWLTVARTISSSDSMNDSIDNTTQGLRIMSRALRNNDISSAHIDILLVTSTELHNRLHASHHPHDIQHLQILWITFKNATHLVSRHLKVSVSMHA